MVVKIFIDANIFSGYLILSGIEKRKTEEDDLFNNRYLFNKARTGERMRQQMQIKIPQEYKDNEAKGLCRVCAKPKEQFEKGRSKHCSEECTKKYEACFQSWVGLTYKWLKEHPECIRCNSKEELQVDHIEPVAITRKVFDLNNLQTLCRKCHLVKTKADLLKIKLHKQKQGVLDELSVLKGVKS